ncbi:MAG: hypothetical protein V4501_05170 [Pseudomonadota bacterium]
MNFRKIFSLVTLLFVISNTANAQDSVRHINALWGWGSKNKDPIILTYTTVTNQEYWDQITDEAYAGTSTTDPCSDLTLVDTTDCRPLLSDSNYKLTSAMLLSRFGPAKTCIRFDAIVGTKFYKYTTGNIKLTWDESKNSYTTATPSFVGIDVSPVTAEKL